MKKKVMITNLQDLKALAKIIAAKIKSSDILCLQGDLGVGKTTFVQFLALYLEVKEQVTSPTFNIVNSYQCNIGILHHLDAYRLENASDKERFDEYIYHDGLTVIEWPEFLTINKSCKLINFNLTNQGREIVIDGFDF